MAPKDQVRSENKEYPILYPYQYGCRDVKFSQNEKFSLDEVSH